MTEGLGQYQVFNCRNAALSKKVITSNFIIFMRFRSNINTLRSFLCLFILILSNCTFFLFNYFIFEIKFRK